MAICPSLVWCLPACFRARTAWSPRTPLSPSPAPFTINPGVVVLNASGQPLTSGASGTAVTLSGRGFAPSATIVKVTMGTHLVGWSPPAIANANGSFSGAAFTVPALASGVYTITVKDLDGNAATVQFTVA